MAIEVAIRAICDVCVDTDAPRQEGATVAVSLQGNVATWDATTLDTRLIELCHEHARGMTVEELIEVARRGRRPEDDGSEGRPPATDRRPKRDRREREQRDSTCPYCRGFRGSEYRLLRHVADAHDVPEPLRPSEFFRRWQCPACTTETRSFMSLGQHAVRVHDMTTIDLFDLALREGDPHKLVATILRPLEEIRAHEPGHFAVARPELRKPRKRRKADAGDQAQLDVQE